jgi:hypothetical protein
VGTNVLERKSVAVECLSSTRVWRQSVLPSCSVLRTTASPFLGAVASILRDWASDTEASRLWGPTTNNWNGRRMQQCTLIRARPSTPTLLHLHSMQSQRATEDTMLQSSGHLGRGRQHERSPRFTAYATHPTVPTAEVVDRQAYQSLSVARQFRNTCHVVLGRNPPEAYRCSTAERPLAAARAALGTGRLVGSGKHLD